MQSDNCFSFKAHPFIYYVCVSFHTQPHAGTTHRPTPPYWPHRGIWLFVQPYGASRPSLHPLPPIPSMHPQPSTLYAVSSTALQVAVARISYWSVYTSANPHLCLFGDDAAALLSDLPLSNGSGLNAEADEAMWGGLSSRLQRRDINLIWTFSASSIDDDGLYHVSIESSSLLLPSLCQGKIDRL